MISELLVYLKPLLLTILFEVIGAILIFKIRDRKDLVLVMIVNLITNPLLVYFSLLMMYYLGIKTGTLVTYLILEPLVIYAEYLIYRKYLVNQSDHLTLSLVLNLISILGGLICQRL